MTDFRHLNMRIAKNNLAYPLLKDTFLVLGSSKCEVLSVLDLKDAFHSLRLSENSKNYCRILPHFGSTSYLYQRMPMGLNISALIWQSLHQCNSQLSSEQEILWSNHGWSSIVKTIKEFSYCKIRRFIKSMVKELFENIPREMSII